MPRINAAGLALIESFEGERLRAYPDPGTGGAPWTIGYGHTVDVHPGDVITHAQALSFLADDVRSSEYHVSMRTAVILTPNQFSALVSFDYNTGAYVSCSPIVNCINERDWVGAMEHLSLYVYAGGQVMEGLVRRRAAEKALFEEAQ